MRANVIGICLVLTLGCSANVDPIGGGDGGDAGGASGDGGGRDGGSVRVDGGDAGGPPQGDGGTTDDGSVVPGDAGGDLDGAVVTTDTGTPTADTGTPTTDMGPAPADLGTPTPDAGPAPTDLGTPTPDAGPRPDAGPTDAGDPCGVLPPNPTDVYVWGESTAREVGTMACPFRTILGALALPAPGGTTLRTIHVRGKTGGLTYSETGTVIVPARITVEGDGRANVIVTTSTPANCIGTLKCLVQVQPGGTLRALTVRAVPGGSGLFDGVAITASPSPGTTQALIENVESTGHGNAAFHSAAGFTLRGSRGTASNVGLHADTGTSSYTIESIAGVSILQPIFDFNRFVGINGASGIATIRNAIASNNASHGIWLTAGGDAPHTVNFTTASDNGVTSGGGGGNTAGILIGPNAFANVNSSTFLGNGGVGLVFQKGAANVLNISCNTFGNANAPARNNLRAATCIENSGATSSQMHRGNLYSLPPNTCPSTQLELLGPNETCLSIPAARGYNDLVYKRSATGGLNPWSVSLCSIICS